MHRTVQAGSMIRTGEEELARSQACLASGVALIAVRGPDGLPRHARASAFNSVSLDPPLLLWCMKVEEFDALGLAPNLSCGVSVLSDADAHLEIDAGARRPDAVWDCGDCLGVPVLGRAAASFEAVMTRSMPQGDSVLCFAEVARFAYSARPGLLRFAGQTVQFSAISDR